MFTYLHDFSCQAIANHHYLKFNCTDKTIHHSINVLGRKNKYNYKCNQHNGDVPRF